MERGTRLVCSDNTWIPRKQTGTILQPNYRKPADLKTRILNNIKSTQFIYFFIKL